VAFELLRESKAKEEKLKRKAEGKKPLKNPGATTYLASSSGISAIAKVVQHFRFDRALSNGLQQLFKSIKGGGASKDEANKQDDKSKKRKADVDDEGPAAKSKKPR